MNSPNSNPPPTGSAEHPTLTTGWLDGVKRMDSEAWSRLVTTFGPIVYRWCRTSGVKESDAPDLVQDVFAAVARNVERFEREKEQGSFRSWLATITRSKVTDLFRRHAKRQEAMGGTEALAQLHQHPEELDSTICPNTAEQPILKRILHQVRSEFEVTTWDAFWLTTAEGMNAAAVAERLGVSVASVYQAKSRVLRRLRKHLDQVPE